ncbi:conserved hypothetical protein [Perkinsus marinus ATCC 50983]|uniref:Fatty acid desaturase domain-containing protein n=1 Tax=Perkinsus marinus (strain ATCC 50983 / TXsc) TaxID=423536 RepID=C5KX71_PERM5|nr:conserved hypothetical protein [Perkinsus marinus ATCC 50983]EER10927.1 conserved hypothetical protein [Perkinsus marinus ATCC 50983]|eukprot:XP_002779132.1 conserved hypothetical protein [Perkinsus marinus ATCC 50983]
MLLFGYPIYLFWNVSGGRVGYDGRSYNKTRPSHFNPEGGLFPPHMKEKVLLSVLGCAISLLIAAYCTTIVGFHNVMLWYGYPYLFTNGWLTLYTSLEHTHKDVPHYGDEAFTFIRGALTSIDRPSYGFFSSCFHHDVGDTHVLHHIDSRIPCYHAREATEAIKPVLGHYYREDNTPIVKAFLRAHRDCKFIRGLTGVQFYEPGQSAEFFGRSLRLPLEGALESTGVAAEANATPESEEVRKEIRDEIDHLVGAALRIRDDEVSTARGRLRRGPPVVGSTVLVYEAGIAGKGGTYNRQPYVVDDIFDGTTLKLSKVGEPSSVRTSHYLNVRPYYGSSAGHVRY